MDPKDSTPDRQPPADVRSLPADLQKALREVGEARVAAAVRDLAERRRLVGLVKGALIEVPHPMQGRDRAPPSVIGRLGEESKWPQIDAAVSWRANRKKSVDADAHAVEVAKHVLANVPVKQIPDRVCRKLRTVERDIARARELGLLPPSHRRR